MIVNKDDICKDDLSDFEDYLAEFDSIISFDSETCSVCGLNVSDNIIVQKPPFVKYKICADENELVDTIKNLECKSISFKVEKQIDTSIIAEIKYKYLIFIPLNYLSEIQK
jgi:hypothetical protein